MNRTGFVREPYGLSRSSGKHFTCSAFVFTCPDVHMTSGGTVYVPSKIPVLMRHRCAAFSQVM